MRPRHSMLLSATNDPLGTDRAPIPVPERSRRKRFTPADLVIAAGEGCPGSAAPPELRRSMAAGRHYFDYEIADSIIAQHGGRRKGVRLDQPGGEVLRAFRSDGCEP